MANPSVVQYNTNATVGTSVTVALLGTPTAGNQLVASFSANSSYNTPTVPAGWTYASVLTGSGVRGIYSKISDGTETGITFTVSASTRIGVAIAECVGQLGTLTGGATSAIGPSGTFPFGPTDAPASPTSIPLVFMGWTYDPKTATPSSGWAGQISPNANYAIGVYNEAAPNAVASGSLACTNTSTSQMTWINAWIDPTSGGGTTVALTGQSAATAQGASAPAQASGLNGQQVASGKGSTAPAASTGMLGVTSTLALGSAHPGAALTLSGLSVAVALGTLTVPSTSKQIILTSGTSWTVPSDWNSANNKVECVAAGAAGGSYGGGGGAYARKNNLALTPGASVSFQVGVPGTGTAAATWLGSTSTVYASRPNNTAGGAAASSIGDVVYSGGSASTSATASGGGGAAGPNGDGVSTTAGSSDGGAGDAGSGGAGSPYVASGTSSPGGSGTEWGTAGSGGGGGGNGTLAGGNPGGTGGNYGGGGGGSAKGVVSAGAPGVIVITYTPASTAVVVPLVGSSAAFAGGLLSVVSGTSVQLSGIASSWSVGSTLPGANAALSGQLTASALGTLTVFTSGVNIALSGRAFTAQSGAFKPQSVVAAPGLSASIGKGTLTVIGGNVYVALTGQSSTAMLGRIGGHPAGLMLTGLALSTGCCRARLVPGNAPSLGGYTITTRSGFLAASSVRNITAPLVGMAVAVTGGTMAASTGIVL